MLEKIEKELGLSYRPDGTPFQDRAKYPKYLPGSFNKHTWFDGWPVPFRKKEPEPTLEELDAKVAEAETELAKAEAEYKAAVAASAKADAEYEAAEAELAKVKADLGE